MTPEELAHELVQLGAYEEDQLGELIGSLEQYRATMGAEVFDDHADKDLRGVPALDTRSVFSRVLGVVPIRANGKLLGNAPERVSREELEVLEAGARLAEAVEARTGEPAPEFRALGPILLALPRAPGSLEAAIRYLSAHGIPDTPRDAQDQREGGAAADGPGVCVARGRDVHGAGGLPLRPGQPTDVAAGLPGLVDGDAAGGEPGGGPARLALPDRDRQQVEGRPAVLRSPEE